jgi:hypothetical protein
MNSCREAAARLPLSTICTKYRNCRMSIAGPFVKQARLALAIG